ncbi:2-methoxy-6-polyprenyl-1,4-benzoquinol methylase, mitochondrial [subsurface metagenome]
MKKTDYSKIADRYDKNKKRKDIQLDTVLEEYIKRIAREEYYVLDLACGTGNYLSAQVEAFKEYRINWFGLDSSEEMLQIAKDRVNNVEYYKGFAEDLPYEPEKFDFIANNYAFHHFEDKPKVLDAIKRILRKDGILHMKNISTQHMKRWWIYQYFPMTYNEDQKRFWQDEQIFQELENRGFEVQIKIDYTLHRTRLFELHDQAKNRDISQLNIISEKDYEQGLNKMKQDLKNAPNLRIVSEGALLSCVARKNE